MSWHNVIKDDTKPHSLEFFETDVCEIGACIHFFFLCVCPVNPGPFTRKITLSSLHFKICQKSGNSMYVSRLFFLSYWSIYQSSANFSLSQFL